MLGGSFFPFEAMPEGMAALGRRTPNGWALERFKELTTGVVDPAALLSSGALLLCICGGLFAWATLRLRGAFGRG